jgi:putative serine protease PepD
VTISVAGSTQSGTGSGEVIDNGGNILTNNHVIAAAAASGSITVIFNNGSSQSAQIVGRDPQTDIAVLHVANGADLRPIAIGSSEHVQVGQPVVALGAPLGLSNTVTSGIVSARDRSVNVPADNGGTALLVAAIQTDAAINPGNSGGALVDCNGDLIGIPTAGAAVPTGGGGATSGSIGLGFAIPVDFARQIAAELIAHGKVSHGYMGLSVSTLASGNTTGLYVTNIDPIGPAAQAGLKVGDLITEVNGEPATNAEQLLALTLTNSPGSTVKITYTRNGASATSTLTLGSS